MSLRTLTASFLLLAAFDRAQAEYTLLEDLPVYTSMDHEIHADIYLPNTPSPHPTVIYVHGGAWRSGDKGDAVWLVPRLVERGFAVVATSYRLAPAATFPAQVHDVKATVRWVRANGVDYGLSTELLGIWGDSAGGHLAAIAAFSRDDDSMEGTLGNLAKSSRVQAVVIAAPAVDLLDIPPDYTLLTESAVMLLGCQPVACPDLARTANPTSWLDADDPPLMIFSGDADKTAPPIHSVMLHDAATSAGLHSEIVIFPGEDHDMPSYFTDESNDRIAEFFRRYLCIDDSWRIE